MKIEKYLVAIAAFALSTLTLAQTPCAALGYTGTITFPEKPASSPMFSCAPKSMSKGTGSFPTFRYTKGGVVAWNYCTDSYSSTIQIAVATDAALLDPTAYLDWTQAQFAADTTAALNAFFEKHATKSIDDPELAAIWCPAFAEMRAGLPPPKPYIVTPSTAVPPATTRPTYSVSQAIGGVRNYTPIGTVPISTNGVPTACDCVSTRVIDSYPYNYAYLYCGVTSQPLTVAQCKAK